MKLKIKLVAIMSAATTLIVGCNDKNEPSRPEPIYTPPEIKETPIKPKPEPKPNNELPEYYSCVRIYTENDEEKIKCIETIKPTRPVFDEISLNCKHFLDNYNNIFSEPNRCRYRIKEKVKLVGCELTLGDRKMIIWDYQDREYAIQQCKDTNLLPGLKHRLITDVRGDENE